MPNTTSRWDAQPQPVQLHPLRVVVVGVLWVWGCVSCVGDVVPSPLPWPLPSEPVSPFMADPEFSITSPPDLIQLLGTAAIKYHPAIFSGSIHANMNDMLPNSSLTTELALAWPDPYFCNITSMTNNGAQKQWNGESYQGTVVLVRKGQCTPFTKMLLAAKLQVSAVLIYPGDGCDTDEMWVSPPTPESASSWSCGRELHLAQPGEHAIIPPAQTPAFLSIAAAPGLALAKLLQPRPSDPTSNTNANATSRSGPGSSSGSGSGSGTFPLPLAVSHITVSFPGPNTLVLSELYGVGNMSTSMFPWFDPYAQYVVGIVRQWGVLLQLSPVTGLPTGSLSPMVFTTKPDIGDPCRNRIRHIWCERGHIVLLDFTGSGLTGHLTQHIGAFTELRALYLDHAPNITGRLPPALSQLQQLQVLTAKGTRSITNVDVVANLTSLRYLDMSWNELTYLSRSIWALPNLTYVDVNNNAISSTMLHPLPNPQQWWYIDISNNLFTGSFPSFRNGRLAYLNAANNHFTGHLETESFDGLPDLRVLDLSWNEVYGQVPTLHGSNQLVTLDFTNNSFQGCQPLSWYFPQLTVARLSRNHMTSFNFTTSHGLRVLDLGYNQIQIHGVDLGDMFASSLPPALSYLDLSHNNITCPWSWSYRTSSLYGSLTWLSLSNNRITSMPENIFQLGPLAVPSVMTYLDVSQNQIQGILPNTPPSPKLQSVHFHGNPGLVSRSGTLPSWCWLSSDPLVVRDDVTVDYDCHSVIGYRGPSQPTFQVSLDPSYYGYRGCTCVRGTYGVAPACTSLPTELVVGVSPLTPTTTFSDTMLGEYRLSYGLDTVWTMSSFESQYEYWNATYYARLWADAETRRIRAEGAATYVRAISNLTWYNSLSINEREAILTAYVESQNITIQPTPIDAQSNNEIVRQVIINIQLLPTFNDFGDYIEIFEGGPDLKGTRVLTVRGTDDTSRVLQVTVLASQATLNFRSRSPSGQHFIANYTVSYDCPPSYDIDNQTNACIQQASFPIVSLSSAVRMSVYVVVSFSMLILLLSMSILLYYHTWDIIVAVTQPFIVWLYTGLVLLCAGACAYAIPPSQGEWVCHTRVWMTALPLVIIVSGMLAKAVRARDALDSRMPPFHVWDLIYISLPWVLIEMVLLSIMSSSHVFNPGLTFQADHLIYQCTTQSWYDTWVIVQCTYVAVLMLITMGVVLNYREQCLYSSLSHMLSSLFSLSILSIVLIALNYYLSDPDALLLSRSILQCFGSCCVFFSMICPILVHLYEQHEWEKKVPKKSILKHRNNHDISSYLTHKSQRDNEEGETASPRPRPHPLPRHNDQQHELHESSVMECHFHEEEEDAFGTSIASQTELAHATPTASPTHQHQHHHHQQATDTAAVISKTNSDTGLGSSPASTPPHADHHSSAVDSSRELPDEPQPRSRYVSYAPSMSKPHSDNSYHVVAAAPALADADPSNLTVFDMEYADIQEYHEYQHTIVQQLTTLVDELCNISTMDESHAIVARMMHLLHGGISQPDDDQADEEEDADGANIRIHINTNPNDNTNTNNTTTLH